MDYLADPYLWLLVGVAAYLGAGVGWGLGAVDRVEHLLRRRSKRLWFDSVVGLLVPTMALAWALAWAAGPLFWRDPASPGGADDS